ncbi:MAG: nicotinate (nicotinamide) nucleotide adenylyltransferase [Leptolyngbya sp. DLM2.Bin15]|nr:MAG: nicotinate (nicotinamide) nucleotide adenylyltransferase [Leptolyngbya sp. DLM2.Bin15]
MVAFSPSCPQRLALFGGAFNPPHWGHLRLAQAACDQGPLDQVLWVPSYSPPHKSDQALPSWQQRMQLVERAIASYPQFRLWHPPQLPPPRYGVDLLQTLQQQYAPPTQWTWIVGLDTFRTLPRWYRVLEVAPKCDWLVAPRLGDPSGDDVAGHPQQHCQQVGEQVAHALHQQGVALTWRCLEMPVIPMSSTHIRQQCRDRQPIDHLVPEAIATYLNDHPLYG